MKKRTSKKTTKKKVKKTRKSQTIATLSQRLSRAETLLKKIKKGKRK